MNKRGLIRGGLAATAFFASASLAERVADPFERHEEEYSIEGPRHNSEVFYLSVNNSDGSDDRLGDLMLLTAGGAALGSLLVRPESSQQVVVGDEAIDTE